MSRRRRRKKTFREQGKRNLSDALYPTLDLHGHTEAEANRAVRRWLAWMQSTGEPVGRVITGRGMHSIGPPVLPASIEGLLSQLKGTIVQGYERDPGGGAFTIRIRRTAPSPTVPRSQTIAATPDLIREAEEALAEVGVNPTPSLIEAEVRRILAERRRESS